MPANLENSSVATGLEKVIFLFQPQRKAMPNNDQTTIQLHSHTSKVMLKILQAKLQQYMICEFPDIQDGIRRGRGTRAQMTNIHWITKKEENSRKHLLLLYTTTVENSSRNGNNRPLDLPPEKYVCRSRINN